MKELHKQEIASKLFDYGLSNDDAEEAATDILEIVGLEKLREALEELVFEMKLLKTRIEFKANMETIKEVEWKSLEIAETALKED